MLYRTRVALAIKGCRVEPGTEIDLTQEAAARYGDDLTEVTGESVAPAPEETVDVPLEEMSHAELKDKAKALGLPVGGSKADLIERITLAPAPEEAVDEEELVEDDK